MNTIQSWNNETEDTETVKVTTETVVMLGCEYEPVTTISDWMDLQEISSLEEMCDYIDGLDFNVQVVG